MTYYPDGTPKRRTLLVHSDHPLRAAYSEMLERCGHQVTDGATVDDALAAAGSSEALDLAVLEALSHARDVLDLVEALRRRHPGLQVVVLSTFGEDARLTERADRGEITVLQAPFTVEALEAAVEPRSQSVATPTSRRRWPRFALAVAATLVALVAAAVYLGAGRAPRLPVEVPRSAVRGADLDILEPMGILTDSPGRFAWRAASTADRYRITIFAPDRTILWGAETTSPDLPAPTHVVTFLPAVRYSWEVEALDAIGGVVARSRRQEFELTTGGSTPRRQP